MNDRRTLIVIAIVFAMAVLATVMLAVLAIADADASEKPCPPHSTIQNYGGPDRLGVHVTQPVGEPHWAYVVLFAPDGQHWTYFQPLFGQFHNTIPGQWRVCFTQDLDAVLAATGWGKPTTTTTTTTTPTVAAEAETPNVSAPPKPTAANGRIPRSSGVFPQ